MDKLNATLRNKAIELGLCNEWQKDWSENWSNETLVSKFFDGMDFCLSHNYPSNEFIKANFDDKFLIRNNVLVDVIRSILNSKQAAIFGNSMIKARYNGRACGRIYIKDNAALDINACNNSFVIVHVLGNAKVTAKCNDSSVLVVIRHSKECKINCFGNVAVKDEIGLYGNP